MAQRNVVVTGKGQVQDASGEAQIIIDAGEKDLTIVVKDYLTVPGVLTEKGNLTIATTHGNIMLGNQNLSLNLWQRGGSNSPRRNVTIK